MFDPRDPSRVTRALLFIVPVSVAMMALWVGSRAYLALSAAMAASGAW